MSTQGSENIVAVHLGSQSDQIVTVATPMEIEDSNADQITTTDDYERDRVDSTSSGVRGDSGDVSENEDVKTGKKYQKENNLLKILPYYDLIDQEAENSLTRILNNLRKCCLSNDFDIGLPSYIKYLKWFLAVYGRRFTKEQHINLIQFFINIYTLKECPLHLYSDVGDVLKALLSKLDFLTREDLEIEWRPFYDLLLKMRRISKTAMSNSLTSKLEALIKDNCLLANPYFKTSTFQEVIDEFMPYLCPTATQFTTAIDDIMLFLPYFVPETMDQMNDFVENTLLVIDRNWAESPSWEWRMLLLFSRFAWKTFPNGNFNWDAHLPYIYSKIVRGIDLPIYFKSYKTHRLQIKSREFTSFSRWIVSTFGGNNEISMKHFKIFMTSLETYFNPSNSGKWTTPISLFLTELVSTFTYRLRKERTAYFSNGKKKNIWWYRIKDEKKLTDSEVETFSGIVSKIVFDYYLGLGSCSTILRNLALISPKTILPLIMEKYTFIVDTLTEPRKFLTCLVWTGSATFQLASCRKEVDDFDGRHHILPFCLSLLPAIDSNDIIKTFLGLNCIHNIFNYIPIVDCSNVEDSFEDEYEKELCRSTSYFEDFLLQFIDRILILVENRAHENTRMDTSRPSGQNMSNFEDMGLETVVWGVFHRFASQASTSLCKAASSKLISYALSNSLETDISGKLFCSILQAISSIRPDIIFSELLPKLCSSINGLITEEILDEEDLDKSLLFKLQILSYILESNGCEILKYKAELNEMISNAIKLNGKKAYKMTSLILKQLLYSLVNVYPLECKITEDNIDDPNYRAIKDWGKATAQLDKKNIKWHIPSQEEINWAIEIFSQNFIIFSAIFDPENMSQKNEELNKRLLKNVLLLQSIYCGIAIMLKFWQNDPILSEMTAADMTYEILEYGYQTGENSELIKIPKTEENVAKKYFEIYNNIFGYLEKFKEDDTEAYMQLANGYEQLLLNNCETHINRRMLDGSSLGKGSDFIRIDRKYRRMEYITKAYNLHLSRTRSLSSFWAKDHLKIIDKLFELCINRYARVRSFAQGKFGKIVDFGGVFLRRIVSNIFSKYLHEGVPHHQHKGTLYSLYGCYKTSPNPLVLNSWEEIYKLFTSLINSPFSEKNSIIKCLDMIKSLIGSSFCFNMPILPMSLPSNHKMYLSAQKLVSDTHLKENETLPDMQLDGSLHYKNLINELFISGSDPNNHWRKRLMCCKMIRAIVIQEEVTISKEIIQFFYEMLTSDLLDLRTVGSYTLNAILKFFKRKHSIVFIDSRSGIELAQGESIHSVLIENKPSTYKVTDIDGNTLAQDLFIDKICFGYAALPQKLKVNLDSNFEDNRNFSNQCQTTKNLIEITNQMFLNDDYLKKLVGFWTLQEKLKGQLDKRSSMLKFITRSCGPNALIKLIELLGKMVNDEEKRDQWNQRFYVDVTIGIICGLKNWKKSDIDKFWVDLKPILNQCLDIVTQETIDYWTQGLGYPLSSQDPNKMSFFIEFFMERYFNSISTMETTSVDSRKDVVFLGHVVTNLQWKGLSYFKRILESLKIYFEFLPNNLEQNQLIPYLNVRKQIGRLLSIVFEWNVSEMPNKPDLNLLFSNAPSYGEFVDFILKNINDIPEEAKNFQPDSTDITPSRVLLNRYKTVLEWTISNSYVETSINSNIYRIIPLACIFESYELDPEVSFLSGQFLGTISKMIILPENVNIVLDTLFEVISSPVTNNSWRSKICVLEFIKVSAFNNASTLGSQIEWEERILDLVLILLKDKNIEVRVSASSILCGFLHCNLIQKPQLLLKKFKTEANKFLQKTRLINKSEMSSDEIDVGHSAILGLCAFVDCHPYDVPSFIPDILVTLTYHMHQPQPIPETIKKCMSKFRRTHQDNWAFHKTKFTEDELTTLMDIFVSACYYA